jgi:hypothetical protein
MRIHSKWWKRHANKECWLLNVMLQVTVTIISLSPFQHLLFTTTYLRIPIAPGDSINAKGISKG